ncbi:MAG: CPBP family intramembrane metalloprotease [Saprospiraceae bacterium]|nr:CPBP family intramembrane metalloprotease [Saprospiraceae bacterium]
MTSFPSLSQAFVMVVKLMLWSLLFGLPLVVLMDMGITHPEIRGLATAFGYAIPFLLIIRAARKRSPKPDGEPLPFNFTTPPIKMILILIPVTIAMGFIGEQIAYLVPGTETLEELMRDMLYPSVFTFITTVILAPLLEELLFRGVILRGFLKNMSPAKGIFWSALLFGGVHMIPAQAVSAFFAGLLIGWLYYRTLSLWPCIFVHFINNLLSYSLFLYFGEATTNELMDTTSLLLILTCSIGILVLGIYIIEQDTLVQPEPTHLLEDGGSV